MKRAIIGHAKKFAIFLDEFRSWIKRFVANRTFETIRMPLNVKRLNALLFKKGTASSTKFAVFGSEATFAKHFVLVLRNTNRRKARPACTANKASIVKMFSAHFERLLPARSSTSIAFFGEKLLNAVGTIRLVVVLTVHLSTELSLAVRANEVVWVEFLVHCSDILIGDFSITSRANISIAVLATTGT